MNDLNAKKYALTCPGDTIAEFLDTLGWTEAELATRLGWAPQELRLLLSGACDLTREKADALGAAFDLAPGFWLELEARYREDLAEIARLETAENAAADAPAL